MPEYSLEEPIQEYQSFGVFGGVTVWVLPPLAFLNPFHGFFREAAELDENDADIALPPFFACYNNEGFTARNCDDFIFERKMIADLSKGKIRERKPTPGY
ncbi:hypothetical protein I8F96_14520 [Enterococcus casseliflavus]|nr:hypothetical protein [Enterococcus casseliflavus]